MTEVIDISHWEPVTDWVQVRASPLAQAVIAKVTEGTTYLDPTWETTRTACLYQGIPISGYHFYRYGLSPAKQADWFASKVGSPDVIQTVWADVESAVAVMLVGEENAEQLRGQSDPQIWHTAATQYCANKATSASVDSLNEEIARVESRLASLADDVKIFIESLVAKGYEVGFYSSPAFIKAYFSGASWLANYPLWIANYGVTTPAIPLPWSAYGAWGVNPKVPLWQYTDALSIPGIDGAVDGNHWSPAAGDVYVFFGNGEPFEEGGEMPNYVFSLYTNLRIRNAVWGTVVGYTTDLALAYKVLEQVKDTSGNLWYRIGRSRWVMGSYCEVVL